MQWNAHKRVYDAVIAGACVLYLGVFVGVGLAMFPAPGEISPPILLIRAFGTLAIGLLHVILLIGPLARLSDQFAPLLYNRRHLGVTFFLAALAHGLLATLIYGGFGVRDPVSAVIAPGGGFASVSGFPFEFLGLLALLIAFAMAATSHDFWLANLGPRTWKTLHMLVYLAYALVVMHVVLGALQSERSRLAAGLLVGGVVVVSAMHVAAGVVQARRDRRDLRAASEWLDVAAFDDVPDQGACGVSTDAGEIAVFRDGDRLHAVGGTCVHQGGPLAEGRLIDGCVTCPWHGYQYRASDGCSPPPYSERIPTYQVRVRDGRVEVAPERASGSEQRDA